MADTSTDETEAQVTPSNETGNTETPTQVTSSADVEAAARKAEAERHRANQLANELAKLKEAQAEAERKQLQEKEEYKTLYEKTDAELKAIREEKESQERASLLASETDNVFKDYPANVVEVAKTAGIALTDDSEAARAVLKEKLDSLASKVGTPVSTSNNPAETGPAATAETGRLGKPRSLGVDDGTKSFNDGYQKKFSDYVKTIPGIQTMKQQAGYSDPSKN